MSGHANRGFGDIGHAVHLAWAEAIARGRRIPIGTVTAILVALLWIAASGWWAFARPRLDESAAQRYQAEVVKCRELPTSEARYECVSRALIGRDRDTFGRSMLVFLPPLALLIGGYIRREMRAAVRERERARLAEERSRRQLAQFHRELMAEREALKPAKRADWETSWAEEIAQAPRRRTPESHGQQQTTEPHAPAHGPAPHGTAPQAVKRA